jgi:NADPH-dependent glutamate synthase beta subunit-like oxidoreductase
MGINIRTSVKFGVDLTLAGLKNSGVDAVILAIGTHQALTLGIKNEGKVNGYFDCLTFLRKYAKNEPMDLGDQVIVIGGGYAAIDAARVAIRSGAKDVSIFYRRGPDEMPAKNEVKEGEEEGVRVNYLAAPTMLIVKNGQIQGLEFIRTKLGETDESGRKTAVPIKGSELVVKASSIISAVGQQPDFSWNQEDLTFQLSPRNTFIVDADGATNMEGVFAAGDAVNGPTTIVEAMANGRRAAQGVEAYLSRKD